MSKKTLREMFEQHPNYNYITEDIEVVMWEKRPELEIGVNERMEYIFDTAKTDCKVKVWATELDMPSVEWGELTSVEERCVSREEAFREHGE